MFTKYTIISSNQYHSMFIGDSSWAGEMLPQVKQTNPARLHLWWLGKGNKLFTRKTCPGQNGSMILAEVLHKLPKL